MTIFINFRYTQNNNRVVCFQFMIATNPFKYNLLKTLQNECMYVFIFFCCNYSCDFSSLISACLMQICLWIIPAGSVMAKFVTAYLANYNQSTITTSFDTVHWVYLYSETEVYIRAWVYITLSQNLRWFSSICLVKIIS